MFFTWLTSLPLLVSLLFAMPGETLLNGAAPGAPESEARCISAGKESTLDPLHGKWEMDLNGETCLVEVWVGPSDTLQIKIDGDKYGVTKYPDGLYCVHHFDPPMKTCIYHFEISADCLSGTVLDQHDRVGTLKKL